MALPFGPPENIANIEDAQKWMSDLYSWVISPESSDGPNFLQSGTGGTVRTTQTKLRDVKAVEDFGAVGDGTTDDTAALQAAVNAATFLEFGEAKTYLISGLVSCNHNIVIDGRGSTINSTAATGRLQFTGAVGSEIAVTATLLVSDKTVTAANTFAAGDLVIIRDGVDNSFSAHRTYYNRGEPLIVVSRTAANFVVDGLFYAYDDTTDLNVVKITPITVLVKDLTVTNYSSNYAPLEFLYVKDSLIENVSALGGDTAAIIVSQSYNFNVLGGRFRCIAAASGNQYGFSVSNSHYVTVKKAICHGTRHGTSIGGSNLTTSVPCRNVTFDECIISHDNSAVAYYSADIHGCASSSCYKNCTIYGAVALGGENSKYLNNKIFLNTDYVAVSVDEVVGGEFLMEGNIIDLRGQPTAGTYVKAIGVPSSAVTDDIEYDWTLKLINNEFYLTDKTTTLIDYYFNSASAAWNLEMRGNTFRGDASGLLYLVDYYNDTGTIPQYCKVHDIDVHSTLNTGVGGIKLFRINSGSATGMRLTLPTFSEQTSLETAVDVWYVYTGVNFLFDYGSVKPSVLAEIQNNDYGAANFHYVAIADIDYDGCNIFATTGQAASNFDEVWTFAIRYQYGLTEYII